MFHFYGLWLILYLSVIEGIPSDNRFGKSGGVTDLQVSGHRDGHRLGAALADPAEEQLQSVLPHIVREHLQTGAGKLLLPDQDVFNVLYGHRTLQIDDAIFNYDVRYFSAYLLKSDGQHTMNWVMRNTVFLHFCGRHKPWKNMCLSRFSALYQQYMNLAQKAETNKPHTVGYEKG